MATLVTGGTGFIGSNVVRELAQRGHDVVCLDLVPPDALVKKFWQPWADRVTFMQGDIRDHQEVDRAAAHHKITKLVHLARDTGGAPGIRDQVDINVAGTANVLDLAAKARVDRFLFGSSVNVYGYGLSREGILDEDSPSSPTFLEAAANIAGEMLTREYGHKVGFQTVSVRMGSNFGPMERINAYRPTVSVFNAWTANVLKREPVLAGDRNMCRQYTYTVDTARAIATVLDASKLPHDVYNVAAIGSLTLGDVVQALQILQPKLQVGDDPTFKYLRWTPRAVSPVMDVTRIKQDLGFTPSFDLLAALSDYLEWRRSLSYTETGPAI